MPKKELKENIFVVEPNGVYTIKDAAKYFGCSTRTIDRWIAKKVITGIKLGGVIKFKGQWLIDVMNNKELLVGKELSE